MGAACVIAACGGRSDLILAGGSSGAAPEGGPPGPIGPSADAGEGDIGVVAIPDAAHDAPRDSPVSEAAADVVVHRDAVGACCGDEQNTDYPPDTNCSGITVAWQYVPSCDFAVSRIELHKSGGTVALLDGVGGGPPGVTLWSAPLPSSPAGEPDWEGADVVPPIALTAGHVYYLEESAGICSIASGGVEYPYYGQSSDGSWDGPYQWHPWTSRIIGACH